MEKKIYEEPSVKKVEFDFNECIAASFVCGVQIPTADEDGNSLCSDN